MGKDPKAPVFKDRITKAECIDGLPFESLENILYYKKKMGRSKDLKDIQLIQKYLDSLKNKHVLIGGISIKEKIMKSRCIIWQQKYSREGFASSVKNETRQRLS